MKLSYIDLFCGAGGTSTGVENARHNEEQCAKVITCVKTMDDKKRILDACCGSRMMWFDKDNPLATFMDIRSEEHTLCDGRHLEVKPDVIADFTAMPFADDSFRLVVFDPPHLKKLGQNAWLAKKYGVLLPTWESDIKAGFDECMRVLEPYGVLIFKWNECQIKVTNLLRVLDTKPLFGHPTGRNGSTVWMCFMKIPSKYVEPKKE